VIMWDSRTAHCSAPALEDTQASGLLRMASLVCMMPRRLAPEDVIERRKQAPLDVTSTTNWSDRWINADEFPQLLVEQDPGLQHRRELRLRRRAAGVALARGVRARAARDRHGAARRQAAAVTSEGGRGTGRHGNPAPPL